MLVSNVKNNDDQISFTSFVSLNILIMSYADDFTSFQNSRSLKFLEYRYEMVN